MTKNNSKILFLDFDGVLCDSCLETARISWMASSEIWKKWQEGDIPTNYLKKFKLLRPLLETGYEAIALIKMIDEDYSEGFIKQNFHFLKEQFFTSASMNRENLIKLFGKVRDDWARLSPATWLKWHKFYPCASPILEVGKKYYKETFIVTTKEKRFAEKLLNGFKIDFDPGKIYGLESGERKGKIIADILREQKDKPSQAVIVEDRLKTLLSFTENPSIKGAALFLAGWGYVFPDDLQLCQDKGIATSPENVSLKSVKPLCVVLSPKNATSVLSAQV